ncbi:KxDL motif-containing protein 1 [Saitoella coloradoensis]
MSVRDQAEIVGKQSVETSTDASSSYAGSDHRRDNEECVNAVAEMLSEQLSTAFDTLALDKAIAIQAQTSGLVHGCMHESTSLQEESQRKLAVTKLKFSEHVKIARQIRKDLDDLQKSIRVLQRKMKNSHPIEYAAAKDNNSNPEEAWD